MVVESRQNGCAAWSTDRIGAKAIIEPGSFISNSVKIRRLIDSAVVAAHSVRSMVIAHDKNDIGSRVIHMLG